MVSPGPASIPPSPHLLTSHGSHLGHQCLDALLKEEENSSERSDSLTQVPAWGFVEEPELML